MHGDGSAASMPPARADALDPPRSLRLRRLSGMNLWIKDLFVSDAELDRNIKLTVRVSLAERAALRQRAFAAGLPVAVFMRTSALSGAPVAPMPPAPSDLPDPCKKVLNIAHAGVSNLSQLWSWAAASGDPLDRLCPLLLQMQQKVRELGLRVKAGDLREAEAVDVLAKGLLEGSALLNALAETLNQQLTPTHKDWYAALTAFKNALEQVK